MRIGLGLGVGAGTCACVEESDLVGQLPGLVFLLDQDAADLTDAGAGACSAWADTSGAGIVASLTQGTAANRPTIGSSPVKVTFDGTNDLLTGGTTALTSGNPITVGIRFRLTAAAATFSLITIAQPGSNAAEILILSLGGYQNVSFIAGIASAGSAMSGFSPTHDTSVHTLVVTYNGSGATTPANYTATWDGVAQTVVASGNTTSPRGNALGARFNGTLHIPAEARKVVVCEQVIAGADLATLEAYLATDLAA